MGILSVLSSPALFYVRLYCSCSCCGCFQSRACDSPFGSTIWQRVALARNYLKEVTEVVSWIDLPTRRIAEAQLQARVYVYVCACL